MGALPARTSASLGAEVGGHHPRVGAAGTVPSAVLERFRQRVSQPPPGGRRPDRRRHSRAARRPAQVAQQISQISHAVFAYGFVDAMKATLYLPIAVLLVGAVATLLIQRRVASAGAAAWQQPGAAGAQTRAS